MDKLLLLYKPKNYRKILNVLFPARILLLYQSLFLFRNICTIFIMKSY